MEANNRKPRITDQEDDDDSACRMEILWPDIVKLAIRVCAPRQQGFQVPACQLIVRRKYSYFDWLARIGFLPDWIGEVNVGTVDRHKRHRSLSSVYDSCSMSTIHY